MLSPMDEALLSVDKTVYDDFMTRSFENCSWSYIEIELCNFIENQLKLLSEDYAEGEDVDVWIEKAASRLDYNDYLEQIKDKLRKKPTHVTMYMKLLEVGMNVNDF